MALFSIRAGPANGQLTKGVPLWRHARPRHADPQAQESGSAPLRLSRFGATQGLLCEDAQFGDNGQFLKDLLIIDSESGDKGVPGIGRNFQRIVDYCNCLVRCRAGGQYVGNDNDAYPMRRTHRPTHCQEQARRSKLRFKVLILKFQPVCRNSVVVDAEHIRTHTCRFAGFVYLQ
jgi:hypothetical protein